ncbi:MAG: protease modulator HflC [Chloroflexi bacterium]|jgi:modulator of FtsH protease HflC|nr:protease modulator HflC [Chloroflexota bacterium]MBT4073222.1 protease modulator HflC [Chloroflexota bacterium]MBT4514415.1 protease modulator HflC [Chloroflexota bacterium]
MRKIAIPLLIILIVVGVVASQTLYIVDVTQVAIVTRLGEFQESKRDPGLAVKVPFVESVTKLDKRLLRVDAPPASLLTLDKRTLVIDAFARYRITDPLIFFQALRTEASAEARIGDIVNSNLRREVALDLQSEIIDITREEIMQRVTASSKLLDITREDAEALPGGLRDPSLTIVIAGRAVAEDEEPIRDRIPTPEQLEAIINSPAPLDFGLDIENFRYRVPLNDRFGIEVVDVRIKRADFPSNVSSSVFDRMRAERERIASAERAEGAQIDLEKRADVDRQVEIITQTAQGDSARIRGEAEGEAIGILAEQLGRDEEFYAFTRSLEAYKALLAQDSTLILNVDSDLWRYLESPSLPADR